MCYQCHLFFKCRQLTHTSLTYFSSPLSLRNINAASMNLDKRTSIALVAACTEKRKLEGCAKKKK
ncbi:unnamed protein product, partial [Ixodes persulcatus]